MVIDLKYISKFAKGRVIAKEKRERERERWRLGLYDCNGNVHYIVQGGL